MNPLLSASLLAGALETDHRSSLRLMISQPICGGLLAGLALGSVRDGFLAGSLVQMLFLGMIPVRGAPLHDLVIAGIAAPALFILSLREAGTDPSSRGLVLFLSLAAALFAAAAGMAAYRIGERRSSLLWSAARRAVEKERFRLASAIHFSSLFLHFAFGFAATAFVVAAGVPAVSWLAGALAGAWSDPLGDLPALLPFIGAGSLLMLHLTRVRILMFLAGFSVVLLIIFLRS